ncbi:hypothetical protein P0W64_19020 [Tsukamurella sp. 8F]|uniref:hypothetical protein n=1 Tax=unclassified Tsukamurella TaxID=2633480 RepID=UPI0023B8CF3E|nr:MULTISPECIES: hypothetical protein [unclassified Tsukamurella]MDF0531978.1 hypothetical protein [Tsukamurella sp. 8J]MDF0588877.1 hypothetical protein [Tsukamurella sp. 8F]
MTTRLRIADRVVTGLVGALLLVGAVWVIGDRCSLRPARWATEALAPARIADVTAQPWWTVALAAVGVVALALGLWSLLARLRPRSVHSHRHDTGDVDLARLADAAAEDLAQHPAVQKASADTRTERGRPVVRLTVSVAPDIPTSELRRLARICRADLRQAAGPEPAFQLQVDDLRPDMVTPRVV